MDDLCAWGADFGADDVLAAAIAATLVFVATGGLTAGATLTAGFGAAAAGFAVDAGFVTAGGFFFHHGPVLAAGFTAGRAAVGFTAGFCEGRTVADGAGFAASGFVPDSNGSVSINLGDSTVDAAVALGTYGAIGGMAEAAGDLVLSELAGRVAL